MDRKEFIELVKRDFKRNTGSDYDGNSRYLVYNSNSDTVTLMEDTRSCFIVRNTTYINKVDTVVRLCGQLSYSKYYNALWEEFCSFYSSPVSVWSLKSSIYRSKNKDGNTEVYFDLVYNNGTTNKNFTYNVYYYNKCSNGSYSPYSSIPAYKIEPPYYDCGLPYKWSNTDKNKAISYYVNMFKNNLPPSLGGSLAIYKKLNSFIEWVHSLESTNSTCCLLNCFNQSN